MIRTPMVLLAGALFAGGCQHAVFGQKSYGPGNVNGTAYTGGAVHGNAEFRDSMSGSDGYATRTMPTDSARVASSMRIRRRGRK